MSDNKNTGHGHVFPRPDGVRARCGGPGLCAECSRDLARKNDEPPKAETPPTSNGMSLLDEARQFVAEGHKGRSLVKQLLAAIEYQYAEIQRLRSERDSAREALRISEQRVREHWPERDRLRHERNAAHRKADRLLTALKSIRDLRCSAFRTYQQDTEDMRAIASRATRSPQ